MPNIIISNISATMYQIIFIPNIRYYFIINSINSHLLLLFISGCYYYTYFINTLFFIFFFITLFLTIIFIYSFFFFTIHILALLILFYLCSILSLILPVSPPKSCIVMIGAIINHGIYPSTKHLESIMMPIFKFRKENGQLRRKERKLINM